MHLKSLFVILIAGFSGLTFPFCLAGSGNDFDPGEYLTKESMEVIKSRAERGDHDAQAALGYAYFVGHCVSKDQTLAVRWFEKSAYEVAYASFQLGNMYLYGDGVQIDVSKGFAYLCNAAKMGDHSAQVQVGMALLNGVIPAPKGMSGISWLKAYSDGNAEIMLLLGDIYAGGQYGEKVDLSLAFRSYLAAAKLGETRGQLMAARCYWHGLGIKEDRDIAELLFREAGKSGSSEALIELQKLMAAKKIEH